jgi:hypothetical protein
MKLFPVFGIVACCFIPAWSQSTMADDASLGWAPNIGWVQFKTSKGVVAGDAFLQGYAWSASTGWIHFGEGNPANGHTYANDGSEYGVNHDGAGNLSGYAWSPNIGWITFEPQTGHLPYRPRIDPASGEFQGYAWSPSCGWIPLGDGLLRTEGLLRMDQDGDGIDDAYEMNRYGNLTSVEASNDRDKDGMEDPEEFQAGTDPDLDTSKLQLSVLLDMSTSEMQFSFMGDPTRVYRLEANANLTDPNGWSPIGNPLYPSFVGVQTLNIPLPGSDGPLSYRCKASLPGFGAP